MIEAQAIIALSRWAGTHLCFPNVHFCACEMDLAIVTKPARLLWEVEVKLSLSDWRADEQKRKWQSPERARIARFWYAVPRELLERVPAFVTPETGLLALDGHRVQEVRPARISRRSPRVTDGQLMTLLESTHYRFWRERLHRHRDARIRQVENQRKKGGA